MQMHKKFVFVFIRKISLDAPPEYHAEIFFVWTPNTIYLKNNSISKKMIKNLCLEIFFNIKKTILTVTIYFSKKRRKTAQWSQLNPHLHLHLHHLHHLLDPPHHRSFLHHLSLHHQHHPLPFLHLFQRPGSTVGGWARCHP